MKAFCILMFFNLFSICYGQTSNYHPFPTENAHWTCAIHEFAPGHSVAEQYFTIVIEDDTSINGTLYHSLNVPYIEDYGNWQIIYQGYQGAIRDDIAGRKIYIVPPDSLSETLLFDFNLQAGDTLVSYINRYAGPVVITYVDSILIDTDYRKRWTTSFPNDTGYVQLIEGIGCTSAFFVPFISYTSWPGSNAILCYSENNQPIYVTYPWCGIIYVDQLISKNDITLYPNPFHTSLMINWETPFTNVDFEIYNLCGQKIFQEKIKTVPYTLERNNIPDGIYFWKLVIDCDKTFSGKIVIN